MRRSPAEEGRRWLEQAEQDLRWARDLATRGGYYLACFLAQQIGEKALKALLYSRGAEVVLGHSVGRLSQEAGDTYPEIGSLCGRWAVLDAYYIPTRYPNGLPDSIPAKVYGQPAAEDAVRLAEEIVQWVRGQLERGAP